MDLTTPLSLLTVSLMKVFFPSLIREDASSDRYFAAAVLSGALLWPSFQTSLWFY